MELTTLEFKNDGFAQIKEHVAQYTALCTLCFIKLNTKYRVLMKNSDAGNAQDF